MNAARAGFGRNGRISNCTGLSETGDGQALDDEETGRLGRRLAERRDDRCILSNLTREMADEARGLHVLRNICFVKSGKRP